MVNHKIAKLSGIIKRQIYQIISEEGLDITPEQWVLLVNLWENDGQTIGDLVTLSNAISKHLIKRYITRRTRYISSYLGQD